MAVKNKYKWFLAGLTFAILWSSAAAATKIALEEAQPLVIAVMRFGIASVIMLFIAHGVYRKALPKGKEWKQLAIYGLLNITIYLGIYIIAMQWVTASVGSLTIAVNPVFISFLSLIILRKPLKARVMGALIICIAGILIVGIPLLKDASVTPVGLILIIVSMLAYSIGTIYFTSKEWGSLHLFVINGWQTFFGGLFLLPFVLVGYSDANNHFGPQFWTGTLWLAIAVSIIAVFIWLWLLKLDAVKAGMWLFLCPVSGIIIAALWVGDSINGYTITGLVLVLAGLALSNFKAKDVKQID